MTVRTHNDHSFAVVITPNFVEAEDIADALRRVGFDNVTHFRSAADARDGLAEAAVLPECALLSLHGADVAADDLCGRLHRAGCRLVLINGDPARAKEIDAAFLLRPYSDTELDGCIVDVMRGRLSASGAQQA
ncbi:hypothetical protein [Tateyamaria sp. syn59]|uniref:hypothetical protein n=1 Tax=Tateyamaria sp. syn59 TaxID=2576942 RepID=UPI0011BE12A5|nr:hypothetical protein [Tateyamaria sp. syn59]